MARPGPEARPIENLVPLITNPPQTSSTNLKKIVTHDTWHVTHDLLHPTPDMWHPTYDMWHMVGAGEHSFKISAPQLFRFGIDCLQDSKRKYHLARPSENLVPLITNPPPTSSTNLKEEEKRRKNMTHDTCHVTPDMWHVTHGGGWTFSQKFSSLALMVWDTVSWRFWANGSLN